MMPSARSALPWEEMRGHLKQLEEISHVEAAVAVCWQDVEWRQHVRHGRGARSYISCFPCVEAIVFS